MKKTLLAFLIFLPGLIISAEKPSLASHDYAHATRLKKVYRKHFLIDTLGFVGKTLAVCAPYILYKKRNLLLTSTMKNITLGYSAGIAFLWGTGYGLGNPGPFNKFDDASRSLRLWKQFNAESKKHLQINEKLKNN